MNQEQISTAANGTKIDVLIADDHSFFRLGLKVTLEQIPLVNQIDEAANGLEVLEKLAQANYDILFIDIEMPGLDGIETVRRIRLTDSKVRIIVLSMHSSEEYVLNMFENKVNGYLLKDTDLQEIKRAIENVMDGEQYFATPVRDTLFRAFLKKDASEALQSKGRIENLLTPREQDVLQMICEQYSTIEIAERLFISINTVKGHRDKLMEKTNAKNLAGLVVFAIKHGFYNVS